MPIYQYRCKRCGDIEVYHRMSDQSLRKCPECGERGLERLICSGVSFHGPKDSFWENLNDGKGMWISGLGEKKDPKAYCRSLNEAKEKAKKKGKQYEIA